MNKIEIVKMKVVFVFLLREVISRRYRQNQIILLSRKMALSEKD